MMLNGRKSFMAVEERQVKQRDYKKLRYTGGATLLFPPRFIYTKDRLLSLGQAGASFGLAYSPAFNCACNLPPLSFDSVFPTRFSSFFRILFHSLLFVDKL